MRKIQFTLFIFAMLLSLFAQISYSETSPDNECLTLGDYLCTDYIKAIEEHQTPIDAEEGLILNFSRVELTNDIYKVSVGGWFDAVTTYIKQDCVNPLEDYSSPFGNTFKRISNKAFSINYEGETIIFEYVGDNAGDWIAKTLFEGNWVGEQKNEMHFLGNGIVMFGGINEHYSYDRVTLLDWPGENGPYSDIIEIGKTKYIFKFTQNDVLLYKIDISKPYVEIEQPTFKLSRVK